MTLRLSPHPAIGGLLAIALLSLARRMKRVPVIETQRLILRAFTTADAHAVQQLAGDPAVAATTLLIPYPYPRGLANKWIATHAEQAHNGEAFIFAICLHATGELIGSIGVHINKRDDNATGCRSPQ